MDYFDLSIESNRLVITPDVEYEPKVDESNKSLFPITKYIRFKKSGYKTLFLKVTIDWYSLRTDGAVIVS